MLVLALDEATLDAVRAWTDTNVQVISLHTLEKCFPQLETVKALRSRMEYVFTLTPWLTQYAMDSRPEASWVTYLDADLYFFAAPEALFTEMEKSSVGIIAHRFTREQRWREKYGIYNVAWVAFRPDTDGLACLKWWSEQCLSWCYDRVEGDRFADQRYLDRFSEVIPSVTVIEHPGADLAPWNLRAHQITTDGNGAPLVDGRPLVFFHFHGLRQEGQRFHFKHVPYLARTTPAIRNAIYRPYCTELLAAEKAPTAARTEPLQRQETVLSRVRSGRRAALRRLGILRGDFVDI